MCSCFPAHANCFAGWSLVVAKPAVDGLAKPATLNSAGERLYCADVFVNASGTEYAIVLYPGAVADGPDGSCPSASGCACGKDAPCPAGPAGCRMVVWSGFTGYTGTALQAFETGSTDAVQGYANSSPPQ